MVNSDLKAYRQPGSSETALNHLTIVLLLAICCGIFTEITQAVTAYPPVIQQIPSDKQVLLNGRIWRNEFSKASGDQFFLTNKFIKGSVTFNGKRYDNLDLMYDIANDELILKIDSYPVISMNKEMIDSFSLTFENRNYHIINAGTDSANILKGYVNVLYNGTTSLYVKYAKKVQPLAVDGRFDLLVPEHSAYIMKGNLLVPVRGTRKLLTLLTDRKTEIKDFIKNGKIKLSGRDPNTYIPVLKYYDRLRSDER